MAGCARVTQAEATTRPAKPGEYAALKAELEAKPYEYRLAVIQRTPRATNRPYDYRLAVIQRTPRP